MPQSAIIVALITGGLALIGTVYSVILNHIGINKQHQYDTQLAYINASIRNSEVWNVSRSEGYKEIWSLTGCLNIFGVAKNIDIGWLSDQLSNWYFNYGITLNNQQTKNNYFLVQEILSFAKVNSAVFKRPEDKVLYCDFDKHPVNVLGELRKKYLTLKYNNKSENSLHDIVLEWKKKFGSDEEQDIKNWILLQFVMSRFRSRLIQDLGLDLSITRL